MTEAKTTEKKYPAPQGPIPRPRRFGKRPRQGKFMIKRCTACGEPHYFPRAICPFCFSDKTALGRKLRAKATIYTFSLMRKSASGPYAIGYVTLKEGPSLQTNFVDCDLTRAEDRTKGQGGVQADRRRAAAVLYDGYDGLSCPGRCVSTKCCRCRAGAVTKAGIQYTVPCSAGAPHIGDASASPR